MSRDSKREPKGVWLPAAPALPEGTAMVKPSASFHEAEEGLRLVMPQCQGESGRHRPRALLLCALRQRPPRPRATFHDRTGQLCLAAVGPDPAAPTRAQRRQSSSLGTDLGQPFPPSGEPRHRPQRPREGRRGQRGGVPPIPAGRGVAGKRQKAVSCHLHRGEEKGTHGGRANPRSLLPVPLQPSRLGSCHWS